MYQKRPTQQFCATLIGILAVAGEALLSSCAGQGQPQPNSFLLSDKSFSVRSRITGQDKISRPLFIHEHYSIGQHRAKLQLGGQSDTATRFYYDARTEASLSYNPELKLCYGETLDDLYQRLFDRKGDDMRELLRVADRTQDVKFIIGPAKLLFLVAHEADKMERVADSAKDDLCNIRNGPVVQYKLNLEVKPGSNVTMFIFYNKPTHLPNSMYTEIPLQIMVYLPDDLVFIDYYGYELMDADLIRGNPMDDVNGDSGVILDMFAFPPSFNCSSDMKNLTPFTLFELYSFGSSRFSFRADSQWDSRSLRHFVAYDGMLQLMRIDTGGSSNNDALENQNELPETTRVLDYRLNRQYTYHTNGTSHPIQQQVSDQRCLVTHITSPEKSKSRQSRPPLSNLLFEAYKFAPMGRAKVHGVGARVFESHSNRLPRWLVEPLLYKDKQGQFRDRMPHSRLREFSPTSGGFNDNNDDEQSDFSVVVYLADEQPLDDADASAGPKLLMLEIYDLQVHALQSYRKTLSVRVHSFSWELSDAPNGESGHDLFSIGQHCSGDIKDEKYAEVDLILGEDGESSQPEASPPSPSLGWLRQWWPRDAALTTAISDTLQIQATLMYDLESRYSESAPGKRSVGVSFRVSEPPMLLYEVTFVGNAEPIGQQTTGRGTTVNSVNDCLWLVDPSESVTFVFYEEDSKTCTIDGELRGFKADPLKSNMFSLNPQTRGEVFRVESQYDRELTLANSWLRDGKFNQILNRLMFLQNLKRSGHSVDPDDIRMRIAKAKIRNFNYISRVSERERQVRPAPFVYPGFGFQHGTSLYTETAFDSLGQAIQSLARCQAACLADIKCKSFSFCTRHPYCVLAEVDLEAPGTRELLAYNRRQLTSGSKFKIESLVGDVQVELVRDFRCELRNKIYMDLFNPSWLMHLSLGSLQIIPVDSIEKCAEICTTKSLELIKASPRLSKQLNELMQADDIENTAVLEALRKQHRKSTEKFCDYFMYLDSSLDEEQQKLIRVKTNQTEPSEYCILETPSSAPDMTTSANQDDEPIFKMNSYRFDFTHLYERMPDLCLVEADKTEEELDAYRVVRQGKIASKTQLHVLRKALDEGKNYQLAISGDANWCGHLCYDQSSGLWPACRSFDMIQRSNKSPICLLNTASLRDMNSVSSLASADRTKELQVWHYEPIFGLISQELENDFRLESLGGGSGGSGQLEQQATKATVSPWFVVAISIGGLFSGLVLGIHSAGWFDGIFVEGRADDDGLASGLVMMTSMSNDDGDGGNSCELEMDPNFG